MCDLKVLLEGRVSQIFDLGLSFDLKGQFYREKNDPTGRNNTLL